jgi:hypothetical protein
MKSAIVFFFDKNGIPIESRLVCHEQQEQELEQVARRMMQAATSGPHVCQCEGKCQHRAA